MKKISPHIKDETYRLLVDAAQDYAIFLIDKEGYIQTWNKGAQRLKGYTAEEIIGKSFKIFYTKEDLRRNHPDRELEIAGEEGRYEEEGWRLKKDGTQFWASVIITKLIDESGLFIGYSKITRDLTERKNAEEKLKNAEENLRKSNISLEEKVKVRTEELEKSNKAKDQFLSIASHELNTPLTTMKMQNQMRLKKLSKSETPFDKHTLEKIFNDDLKMTNRLVKLVEDFLEFSRINAGKMVLKKEIFNLNKIIEDTAARFETRLEHAQIELDVILPTACLEVVCDSFRIEQVLNNLMTNAIKYGLGKPIIMSLEREDNLAIIKVHDQGMGIAQEDLKRIFEEFERAISASEISGMGIGLFIAKQIIDAHNGIIRVESELGKGSTFIVELPLFN